MLVGMVAALKSGQVRWVNKSLHFSRLVYHHGLIHHFLFTFWMNKRKQNSYCKVQLRHVFIRSFAQPQQLLKSLEFLFLFGSRHVQALNTLPLFLKPNQLLSACNRAKFEVLTWMLVRVLMMTDIAVWFRAFWSTTNTNLAERDPLKTIRLSASSWNYLDSILVQSR